jgi:hypothetical protein
MISKPGKIAIFMVVPDKLDNKIHDVSEENEHKFDFKEILATQRLLHKINLAELVRLKDFK